MSYQSLTFRDPKLTFRVSPPRHLTDFGQWLWWRVPVWSHRSVLNGEGWKGLRSRYGFMYAGILVDYYHGYWIQTGAQYWRQSFWIMNRKIFNWKERPYGNPRT